ncbi:MULTISPECIES: undecaprenyl-diphosphate phosphatase [unclassified Fibrobacter]|uniref:undecaprenyl-diphosphate phosphatase n=1 Tax=unclassified Fibrobacter TaxID=2634177 RepID=UPI00091A0CB6|nr:MULTISPECIES: undecaprenyl-diphosphate phosphatase [Fibrobacter]MDO4946246.1 undecaprenyl-diphosphate phosphatase [Fibrobacter sp.]MCL4101068.1 Undecaprenyl-diphosphatase [Fibrobacter succinogenes]OWV07009.1 UDP-diphosphatase [Fibrobacter sp. UWH3]OWV16131.1 UDP-diphosphatase [Fibrobacter sp. UWH1]SHK25340.1 undecaprenyl-diphosphatase [Fibrobacter sp. UWH6]
MIESIILGLLQGLAEFLPISSSGHLVLGKELLGMEEAGMFFDIMLHAGTLLSIFVVFRKKIVDMIVGCIRRDKTQLKEVGYIVLASIPTAIIGIGFKKPLESLFENPRAVCCALLVTATLLFVSQWGKTGSKHPECEGVQMNWWRALVTGVVQGIACIPGISRSGSTISGMIFLGVNRKYAGEFSFLMSIPAVGGAALLDVIKWVKCQDPETVARYAIEKPEKALACADASGFTPELLVGMIVAFIFGIIALKWLMAFVQKGKFHYFSYYLWAAGILGLIFIK